MYHIKESVTEEALGNEVRKLLSRLIVFKNQQNVSLSIRIIDYFIEGRMYRIIYFTYVYGYVDFIHEQKCSTRKYNFLTNGIWLTNTSVTQ